MSSKRSSLARFGLLGCVVGGVGLLSIGCTPPATDVNDSTQNENQIAGKPDPSFTMHEITDIETGLLAVYHAGTAGNAYIFGQQFSSSGDGEITSVVYVDSASGAGIRYDFDFGILSRIVGPSGAVRVSYDDALTTFSLIDESTNRILYEGNLPDAFYDAVDLQDEFYFGPENAGKAVTAYKLSLAEGGAIKAVLGTVETGLAIAGATGVVAAAGPVLGAVAIAGGLASGILLLAEGGNQLAAGLSGCNTTCQNSVARFNEVNGRVRAGLDLLALPALPVTVATGIEEAVRSSESVLKLTKLLGETSLDPVLSGIEDYVNAATATSQQTTNTQTYNIEGTWSTVHGDRFTFNSQGVLTSASYIGLVSGTGRVQGTSISITLESPIEDCGGTLHETYTGMLTSPTSASVTYTATACGVSLGPEETTLTKLK